MKSRPRMLVTGLDLNTRTLHQFNGTEGLTGILGAANNRDYYNAVDAACSLQNDKVLFSYMEETITRAKGESYLVVWQDPLNIHQGSSPSDPRPVRPRENRS